MITSPLTGKPNVFLEREILSKDIIEFYKKDHKIEVEDYFSGVEKVGLYKDLDTGYRFYTPFHIAGDDAFYQQLQQQPWYYMPWKWEHEQAMKQMRSGIKLLEVGSANGDFLKQASERINLKAIGLELNTDALKKTKNKSIEAYSETIETFAENHAEQFDVVCSFQVTEHIAEVRKFIEAQVKALKKNGILIISVPNNDSFIRLDNRAALNKPPHHMGLWNKQSLISLTKIFNLKLLSIDYEPLQSYHSDYYKFTVSSYLKGKFFIPAKMSSLLIPLVRPFMSKNFCAHTIQAVYQKTV